MCAVGSVDWSVDDFATELAPFAAAYKQQRARFRDVQNGGGNGLFHSFALWFLLRKIRPTMVVESGVHMGETSWLIRRASAEWEPLFVRIDPRKLGWNDDVENRSKTLDLRGGRFVDFAEVDWDGHTLVDRSDALVLMDDHFDQLRRVEQARRLGFGHLVFDDNYMPGFGDMFSIKSACDGGISDADGGRGRLRWAFAKHGQQIRCHGYRQMASQCDPLSATEASRIKQDLLKWCDVIWEAPPLAPIDDPIRPKRFLNGPSQGPLQGPAKWTADHTRLVRESTKSPLFPNISSACERMGGAVKCQHLLEQGGAYLNMVYVKPRIAKRAREHTIGSWKSGAL